MKSAELQGRVSTAAKNAQVKKTGSNKSLCPIAIVPCG